MNTIDVISNIQRMMSVIHPNAEESIEVVSLQKHEALDLFFYDRILTLSNQQIDFGLTLEELRLMQSYPCYMVKKNTYGPNEAKAILFGIHGQTIGEFTINQNLLNARQEAEVITYLAA